MKTLFIYIFLMSFCFGNEIDVIYYNCHNDSAYPLINNINFNNAIDAAYSQNKSLKIPSGNYLVEPDALNEGGEYGIRLSPNTHFIGKGIGKTIFYADKIEGCLITIDPNDFANVPLPERNITISDITIIGKNRFNDSGGGYTGGAGIYIDPINVRLNIVIIENVHIIGFGGEALRIGMTDKVIIRNCFIDSCDFVAVTPVVCKQGIIDGLFINDCRYGIEHYSFGNFQFNNIQMVVYRYGIRSYSASIFSLTNFIIERMAGYNNSIGDGFGVQLAPTKVYGNGFGEVNLYNGIIEGMAFNGIHFGSNVISSDTTLGNISLSNITVKNCRNSGIFVNSVDQSCIGEFKISNCNISHNNTANVGSYSSLNVVAYNVDYLNIHDCVIRNNSDNAGRNPIYLNNCDYGIIKNNDFRQLYQGNVISINSDNLTINDNLN